MKKLTHKSKPKKATAESKEGFTIIEVMLTLAITGIMLVGLIGSSYTTIAHQRYIDSLNSFAEYLSRIYSEVISPESLGKGNSSNQAILGKVLVFGHDYKDSEADSRSVFSATIVGSAEIGRPSDRTFLEELTSSDAKVQLFCGDADHDSTVEKYTPLWESELMRTEPDQDDRFQGTIIIARTPTSNVVHTVYNLEKTYDLRDECTSDPSKQSANTQFIEDLRGKNEYDRIQYSYGDLGICLKSDNSSVIRQIQLASDGSNTSAVSILDEEASQCR